MVCQKNLRWFYWIHKCFNCLPVDYICISWEYRIYTYLGGLSTYNQYISTQRAAASVTRMNGRGLFAQDFFWWPEIGSSITRTREFGFLSIFCIDSVDWDRFEQADINRYKEEELERKVLIDKIDMNRLER